MKFDIIEVLTRAAKITWKHKVLWIFGILASCGRGSGSSSNNSSRNNQFTDSQAPREMLRQVSAFAEKITNWFTENLWALIVLILFLLILWVIQIFLSTTGRIGLIRGAYQAEAGAEKINFGELFSESLRYFWRVIGQGLVIFLPIIVIIIGVFAIFIFSLASARPGTGDVLGGLILFLVVGLCCCLFPVLVIVGLYSSQALRALILEDLGVFASLSRGWDVFRKNIVGLLVMAVIIFFGSLIVGLAIAIPIYIAIFPVVFSFLAGNINSWRPFIIAGIFVLLYSPIAWVLSGILLTYTETLWTVIYIRITLPREEAPVLIEANA